MKGMRNRPFLFLLMPVLLGLFFYDVHAAMSPADSMASTKRANRSCAIDISWSQTSGDAPDHFNLIRRYPDSGLSIPINRLASSSPIIGLGPHAYTDAQRWSIGKIPIDPGSKVQFRIQSCDVGNTCVNSAFTPSLTTDTHPAITGAPADVRAYGKTPTANYIEFATSSQLSPLFAGYGGFRVDRTPTAPGFPLFADASFTFNAGGKDYYFLNDTNALVDGQSYTYAVSFYESGEYCVTKNEDGSERPEQISRSPETTITVPASPTGFTATYVKTDGPLRVELAWTDRADNEDSYVVERTNDPLFSSGIVDIPLAASSTFYSDTNINEDAYYYYRVRACHASGGCSYGPSTNVYTYPFAVNDLRVSVQYVSTSTENRTGEIQVRWNSLLSGNFEVIRTGGGLASQSAVVANAYVYKDTNVPFSEEPYVYTVRKMTDSASSSVVLNPWRVVVGNAWAVAGKTGAGGKQDAGLGWIRFTNASTTKYTVQMDRSGVFSGAAWASVSGGHGYAWLSFNADDLKGCPDNPTNLPEKADFCRAIFDPNTSEVRGWARFFAAEQFMAGGQNRWDGWVSLNSKKTDGTPHAAVSSEPQNPFSSSILALEFGRLKEHFTLKQAYAVIKLIPQTLYDSAYAIAETVEYGIRFDRTTRRFYGEAWGGDIAGWIAFTDPESPASSLALECGAADASSKCLVAAQIVNRPPVVDNVKIEEPTVGQIEPMYNRSGRAWCAEEPRYRVRFDYTDLDGIDPSDINSDHLSDVQFSLVRPDGTGGLTVQEYAAGGVQRVGPPKGLALSTQEYTGWFKDPLTNGAVRSTDYKATVRARDSEGAWSSTSTEVRDWALSAATTTPAYYYPLVGFEWTPAPAPIGRITDFFSTSSVNRSGDEASSTSWRYDWIFPHATPGTANTSTVKVVFSRQASTTDATTLTITDKNNNTCSAYEYPVEAATSTTQLKRKIREQ